MTQNKTEPIVKFNEVNNDPKKESTIFFSILGYASFLCDISIAVQTEVRYLHRPYSGATFAKVAYPMLCKIQVENRRMKGQDLCNPSIYLECIALGKKRQKHHL